VKLTDTSSDWDLLVAWMGGVAEPSDSGAPEGPDAETGAVPARPNGRVPASDGWRAREQRGRSWRLDRRGADPQ